MHGGVKPTEITNRHGMESESTAERRELVGNGRNKGGKMDMSQGPWLSHELQQLMEEMRREFTTKRRIKIDNLPANVHEKVRT